MSAGIEQRVGNTLARKGRWSASRVGWGAKRMLLGGLLATVALGVCVAVPVAAQADSTLVVSDTPGVCPEAGYSSIAQAIETAQSHDTIRICPGTYVVGPAEGTASLPANGLTIEKSLTIIGAGASKVKIVPAGPLETATSSPRSALGNIITVKDTKPGSTSNVDVNVTIEGVSIEDGGHLVGAGVVFNNAAGTVADSQVGPFTGSPSPAAGWGVVASNDEAVTPFGAFERNITISNDLITGYGAGGVLVDGSESSDPVYFRSGVATTAAITGNVIEGAKDESLPSQYGVQVNAGARATITGNQITGNLGAVAGTSQTPGSGVGILLTDADVSTRVPGSSTTYYTSIGSNNLLENGYGIFNGTPYFDGLLPYESYVNGSGFTPTSTQLPESLQNTTMSTASAPVIDHYDLPGVAVHAATPHGNWYGSVTGPVPGAPSTATTDGVSEATTGTSDQDSVIYQSAASSPYPKPAVPGAITDLPPIASWGTPTVGEALIAGQPNKLLALATDDFGVDSVEVEVDGTELATIETAPYELEWTPPPSLIGQTVTLTAKATDEGDQTDLATEQIPVAPAPGKGNGHESVAVVPMPLPILSKSTFLATSRPTTPKRTRATAKMRAKARRHRGVLRISGSLVLPAGLTARQACGRGTVSAAAGRSRRETPITIGCRFSLTLKHAPRRGRLTLRFSGNAVLAPRKLSLSPR